MEALAACKGFLQEATYSHPWAGLPPLGVFIFHLVGFPSFSHPLEDLFLVLAYVSSDVSLAGRGWAAGSAGSTWIV